MGCSSVRKQILLNVKCFIKLAGQRIGTVRAIDNTLYILKHVKHT